MSYYIVGSIKKSSKLFSLRCFPSSLQRGELDLITRN